MGMTLARFYFSLRRALVRAERIAAPAFTGFWLGVMGRRTLNAVDDLYHVGGEAPRFSPIDYRGDDYNRMGFWGWERTAFERHFGFAPGGPGVAGPGAPPAHARLAVLAAGGGREVLELRRRGFEVDGWECQPELVRAANRLLASEGHPETVAVAPRDLCPAGERRYGGAILGWGAYTLIQGRSRRIALLRSLRARVLEGAPLLLSFFSRPEGPSAEASGSDEARFRLVAAVANVLRRATLQEPVEVGDYLEPNYVHYFTSEEIRGELEEAGFQMEAYQPRPYGHVLARAV